MKRLAVVVIVVVALVIGYVWWRSHSGPRLNVTPEAEKAIEKAKKR
jgi:hypothetical protein